jgi:hypothetical protein
MVKTMEKDDIYRVETTLDDLIAAASELAFEYSDNDKDGYNLVRFALIEMIKKTAHRPDPNKDLEKLASPSKLIH